MGRFREYDEIIAMSNSRLAEFKRSPEHYKHSLLTRQKTSPALTFGIAFHTYVLENHKFALEVAVMDENLRPEPDKDYKTKVNREWKAQFLTDNQDKEVITTAEFEQIKRMHDKLTNHELANELITMAGNKYEEVIQWNWKRTKCKGLKDITSHHFLADLKTGLDVDPDGTFRRLDFFSYGYYRQAAMYLDGDAGGKLGYSNTWKDFYFIAIEKTAPFGIAVYKPSKEVIEHGLEEYRTLVEQFQSCVDNNEWQGYEFKAVASSIFEVTLPYWMRD